MLLLADSSEFVQVATIIASTVVALGVPLIALLMARASARQAEAAKLAVEVVKKADEVAQKLDETEAENRSGLRKVVTEVKDAKIAAVEVKETLYKSNIMTAVKLDKIAEIGNDRYLATLKLIATVTRELATCSPTLEHMKAANEAEQVYREHMNKPGDSGVVS